MESNKKMKVEMTYPKTLTDLPETIIHDILCLIPFKEAVRTSVLSRSWRRRWRSIPDLDLFDINKLVASQIVLRHSSPLRLLKAHLNSDAFNFLSVQSGPTIRTLHLFDSDFNLHSIARSFPNLTHLQLKASCFYGCVSLDFSGFKTLQTIHLEQVYFFSFFVSVLFSSCPLLEAATLTHIYSSESQQQLDIFAPNLRSLKLNFSITIDGDFSGLKNLRILHLESITFAAHLSKLFSACHFLEEVNLIRIRLQETQHLDMIIAPNLRLLKLVNVGDFWDSSKQLVIITGDGDGGFFSGLKNLRSLHLQHVSFGAHAHLSKLFSACSLLVEVTLSRLRLGDKKQCLDIAAPNLRRLELVEIDYDDCLDDFTISSAPVLEVVLLDPRHYNYNWVGHRGDCKLIKALAGLPNVKKLELWINKSFQYLYKVHIPRRLPISFDHLKIMILNVSFELSTEALLTLCLLRSSPNLHEFEYLAGYYGWEVAGLGPNFWEAQEHLGVFDKRQTVKFTTISCVKAELEFMQFVLAKAQSLKTMIVSFREYSSVGVKEVAMQKILEFPVISKQGQILFAFYEMLVFVSDDTGILLDIISVGFHHSLFHEKLPMIIDAHETRSWTSNSSPIGKELVNQMYVKAKFEFDL